MVVLPLLALSCAVEIDDDLDDRAAPAPVAAISGTVHIDIADDFDGGTSQTIFVVDDVVLAQATDLEQGGSYDLEGLYLADGRFAVSSATLVAAPIEGGGIEAGPKGGPKGGPEGLNKTASRDIIVVPLWYDNVDFSDATITSEMDTDTDSVRQRLEDFSKGGLDLTIEVVEGTTITLPEDPCDLDSWKDEAVLRLTALGKSVYSYDHVAVVTEQIDECDWAGLARVKHWMSINTGGSGASANRLNTVTRHELGHNFGLRHASSAHSCHPLFPNMFDALDADECTVVEYGDSHSTMGSSTPPLHFGMHYATYLAGLHGGWTTDDVNLDGVPNGSRVTLVTDFEPAPTLGTMDIIGRDDRLYVSAEHRGTSNTRVNLRAWDGDEDTLSIRVAQLWTGATFETGGNRRVTYVGDDGDGNAEIYLGRAPAPDLCPSEPCNEYCDTGFGGTSGPIWDACMATCFDNCTWTCSDGDYNGDEWDVDCGGSCPACGNGPCVGGAGSICEAGFVCVDDWCEPDVPAPTCTDGVQNGSETGVDCGGSCPSCGANDDCPPEPCAEYCDTGFGGTSGPIWDACMAQCFEDCGG